MSFQGFVELGDTFTVSLLVRNASGTPINLDSLPTYRVYGPDGFVSGQAGSGSYRHTGNITGATNASPIEITSASHGLTTGARVTVASVGGNTAANGTFTVTRTGDNTFTLNGSTGSGAYTSGGTFSVTGYYYASLTVSGANGYDYGKDYKVFWEGAVSSTAFAQETGFSVN